MSENLIEVTNTLKKPEVITKEWLDSLIDLYHDPELRRLIWQRESTRMEEASFKAEVARNFAKGFSESLFKRVQEPIANGDNKLAAAVIALAVYDSKKNGREYEMQFVPEALADEGIDQSVIDAAIELCKAFEED